MAENKTISELPEVIANATGDMFPVVQNGVTQKTTLSKIKTFFDAIYTTTSTVASQISAALTGYATTAQLNAGLTSKQNKQAVTVINIDAQNSPTIGLVNCILSITNIPSGTGNKAIRFFVSQDAGLQVTDFLNFTVKYGGHDVNLRAYSIGFDIDDNILVSLYLNVHSSPTEPVIISMNKIN